ncbi:MAG: glutamate racemase [Nitrospirae bacterium]|nr:glutamate racemase [Nitrospirota bacterium]
MKITKNLPIGIFDSGLGGLTVLKEIQELLPNENIIYLGDTARVPYGIRTPETIIKYSLSNTNFLIKKDIKLLVVACNTSSATSLESIREEFNIPVIGVIEPGAKMAASVTTNRNIGVIGTDATIKSSAYSKAIHSLNSSIEVTERPCPLFVPLIEEGWLNDPVTEAVAKRYLENMTVDTLVLGCTHYPLIKEVIGRVIGTNVKLVDSALSTALEVKSMLEKLDLLSNNNTNSTKFFVTDGLIRFKDIGRGFLSREIDDIEKIDL